MRGGSLGRLGTVLVLGLLLGGCAGGDADVTVSAAASLADAFAAVVETMEAASPGLQIDLNVAGSSTLVEQVLRGAPVDVLATADEASMARAVAENAVVEPRPFATNELVVAWPADGPARTAHDLADPSLLVGLCAPQVPCGRAARDALASAGITPAPDTEDGDVRTLLGRLAQGELDVGVVYATDLAAADGAVAGAALPGATTTLVVARTPGAPDAAHDVIAFLRSPAGTAILVEHGFTVVEEAS